VVARRPTRRPLLHSSRCRSLALSRAAGRPPVQPPRSISNDVCAVFTPSASTVRVEEDARPWLTQSTGTRSRLDLLARVRREVRVEVFQRRLLPLAACQLPVCRSANSRRPVVTQERCRRRAARMLSPVRCCQPPVSGSVVQSSERRRAPPRRGKSQPARCRTRWRTAVRAFPRRGSTVRGGACTKRCLTAPHYQAPSDGLVRRLPACCNFSGARSELRVWVAGQRARGVTRCGVCMVAGGAAKPANRPAAPSPVARRCPGSGPREPVLLEVVASARRSVGRARALARPSGGRRTCRGLARPAYWPL